MGEGERATGGASEQENQPEKAAFLMAPEMNIRR
jgi:hypothetical protein